MLKFTFHGLRMSEHEDCKQGECLLYCNKCTSSPTYPSKGRGKLKTGYVIYKYSYKGDAKTWACAEKTVKHHFYKNEIHFLALDCN